MAWFRKPHSNRSVRSRAKRRRLTFERPRAKCRWCVAGGLSSALLFNCHAWANPINVSSPASSAQSPTPPDGSANANVLRAREQFLRGLALFNQGDNEGALAAFRSANELVYHPKVWFNIAMVLAEMNQPIEAIDAFERALDGSAVLSPALCDTAVQRREALLDSVGTLELNSATSGALLRIDGVERGHTPLTQPLRLLAGRHVVELLKEDYKLWRRELDVTGRGHFVLEVVMQPHASEAASKPTNSPHNASATRETKSPKSPASNTWQEPAAYTSLALGGAGLLVAVGGVIAGRSLCPKDGCPPPAGASNADQYDNWRTTSIVAAVSAAVFAGSGLVILLTSPDESPTAPAIALHAHPLRLRATLRY